MSLKSFHIVFVTVCTLLFTFLTVWAFGFSPEKTGLISAMGYVGIAGLVIMPVYGVYFIRKARKIHL
jgi:FtsH-binding integral membrane protein